MTAHIFYGATSQLFSASNLLGILLLIVALATLRSKRTAQDINASLQLSVLGVLIFSFVEMLRLANVIGGEPSITFKMFGILIWLLGSLSLATSTKSRPKIALITLATLTPWLLVSVSGALSALGLVTFNLNTTLGILPYAMSPPTFALLGVVLACLLSARSIFIFRYHSIAFFLLGSLIICGTSFAIEAQIEALQQSAPLATPAENPLLLYLYIAVNLAAPIFYCIGAFLLKPGLRISFSRKLSLYMAILCASGLFFTFLIVINSYVVAKSSVLSNFLQLTMALLTSLGLAYIMLARQLRSRLRVEIDKHFFQHKYDYRSVWLSLINTLSETAEEEHFFEKGLKALANIVEANGGAIWLTNHQQEYSIVAEWNVDSEIAKTVNESESFIGPFIDEEWIYALSRSGKQEHDRHLHRLPDWLCNLENLWVIAPLMIGKKLVGFFILLRSENNEALIWEDIDVLKSAGKQMASYIVRQQSAEELALSRQFDTYNKLTAFIMHDLKNLIAQQALVVENAKKHQQNPAFVEDAIRTIDNSVKRMNQLLKRLQRNSHQNVQRTVALSEIIAEAIHKSIDRQPIPMLRGDETDAHVIADNEQIVMILLHVIRNAQDATANNGFIDIEVQNVGSDVMLTIEDNGCGMDEDFIKNRLFKPFDSTKSSMGMGIGAYQVREFIESMGGTLTITSELELGTTVAIQLPTHQAQKK